MDCSGVNNIVSRHNAGFNAGFMDGHAKWIAYTNIPDPNLSYNGGSVNTTGTPADSACHYWYGVD